MHPYREFVQAQMDERGWKAADLARHSGLTKQVVSRILTDDRDSLARPPTDATVSGLARAFDEPEIRIWLRVAASMGLPVGEEILVPSAGQLSNRQLVEELERRLGVRARQTAPERLVSLPAAALRGDGADGIDGNE